MSKRGTSNSPNTRNPERPASNPSRLDQFADDIFEKGKDKAEGVTSRKEKRKWNREAREILPWSLLLILLLKHKIDMKV